jgi:hypothetical protein
VPEHNQKKWLDRMLGLKGRRTYLKRYDADKFLSPAGLRLSNSRRNLDKVIQILTSRSESFPVPTCKDITDKVVGRFPVFIRAILPDFNEKVGEFSQ